MTSRASAWAYVWVSMLFAGGCGGSSSPSVDTDGAESTTVADEASSGESTSSESSTGPAPVWPYDHGYVKISFVPPADAPDTSLLDDTVTIVVAMDYGPCLVDYYESNPFVRQDGELGGPIFGDAEMGGEGWEDLLCSPLFGDHAACSIVWITQRFDVVKSLTVTYDVTADLATKPLFFGPLPTAEIASCSGDQTPSVTVVSAMSVRGIDAAGDDLWEAASWAPAEVASRDEAPLVVTVTPLGD